MRRPEELNDMLRHAEHQEQIAKIQWLRSREKTGAALRQLRELQSYAQDYAAGAVRAGSVGELVNRKHFVDRLQQAIEQQAEVCGQARQTEAAYLERWQKQQQNLKALERLKEQRVQAIEQQKTRLEQRALDEFALQSLGRHK